MKDRIIGGYDNFVLPFMAGVIFLGAYLLIGFLRILYNIPSGDRKKLLISLITPKTILKNIRDIVCDCLIHVKIFKRKALLGYMHASIAFGWFMLILLGHIEVALFVPERNGILYYPVFYRYFVAEQHHTIRGGFFFFLMDFFLLMVLSGIALAITKRFRSIIFGMKRTTKPSLADRIGLYALWSIFPLRLLAEGFTAGISGGGFLTNSIHYVFASFFGNDLNILPTWWAYSIALGLFFFAMPFSRYMHIVTEALLILFRNAGLKVRKPRKGFAEAEIYSCPGCGLCIDACPMNVLKKNVKYSSVYFIRFLRRHNTRKINEIAQKCLMCGKCSSVCPVSIDSCGIRQAQRATITNILPYDYGFLKKPGIYPATDFSNSSEKEKVLYFAGCMTHLTPAIIKSMTGIFEASGTDYYFADKNGGLCCGRPLMLAGKTEAAHEIIEANTKMIMESGCNIMVLNCPICLKIFREEYSLKGMRILHHSQYIEELIERKRIDISRNEESYVYHDPCELGRGCGIYEPPRNIIKMLGELKKAGKERKESICCGGSLGSLTLNYHDRNKITEASLDSLMINNPDNIITACPLCYKTFGHMSRIPVMDLAQAVSKNIIKNK